MKTVKKTLVSPEQALIAFVSTAKEKYLKSYSYEILRVVPHLLTHAHYVLAGPPLYKDANFIRESGGWVSTVDPDYWVDIDLSREIELVAVFLFTHSQVRVLELIESESHQDSSLELREIFEGIYKSIEI